ncbi:hypothetical protein [Methylobacillus glycogenes]|uniref:hypothetical protein n=1 Tax=Methylobacillus glycogenes TaxID=406 RepID=UPI0004717B95|nr:hypothetical protein [Methylobacillus glycogenes]
MPILELQPLNKRDYQVRLGHTEADTDLASNSQSTVLRMSVEQMFSVNFYLESERIACLRFESLSSLNNLELNPIYKLREESLDHPLVAADAAPLRLAAIEHYLAYTNGKLVGHDKLISPAQAADQSL